MSQELVEVLEDISRDIDSVMELCNVNDGEDMMITHRRFDLIAAELGGVKMKIFMALG